MAPVRVENLIKNCFNKYGIEFKKIPCGGFSLLGKVNELAIINREFINRAETCFKTVFVVVAVACNSFFSDTTNF